MANETYWRQEFPADAGKQARSYIKALCLDAEQAALNTCSDQDVQLLI